jgi:hypothetical protein
MVKTDVNSHILSETAEIFKRHEICNFKRNVMTKEIFYDKEAKRLVYIKGPRFMTLS